MQKNESIIIVNINTSYVENFVSNDIVKISNPINFLNFCFLQKEKDIATSISISKKMEFLENQIKSENIFISFLKVLSCQNKSFSYYCDLEMQRDDADRRIIFFSSLVEDIKKYIIRNQKIYINKTFLDNIDYANI